MAKKIVTLTDATLINLAKSPSARQACPALNAIFNAHNGKTKRGCGSCAKRRLLSTAVIATRTRIANSPPALKSIKSLLKADRLIMYVRGPKGTQRREA